MDQFAWENYSPEVFAFCENRHYFPQYASFANHRAHQFLHPAKIEKVYLSQPLNNKWEWYKHTKRREYGAAKYFLSCVHTWTGKKRFGTMMAKPQQLLTAGAKSASLIQQHFLYLSMWVGSSGAKWRWLRENIIPPFFGCLALKAVRFNFKRHISPICDSGVCKNSHCPGGVFEAYALVCNRKEKGCAISTMEV